MTFTLGWRLADSTGGGILPNTLLSGFFVALSKPDSLYERSHWLVRFRRWPKAAYVGILRPEGELDLISDDTGAVSGRVTDGRGVGVPSASIFVRGSELSTLTRSDGSYTIPNVPVGGNSFAARAVGFEPCDRAHVRVVANKATKVDFRLAAAASVTTCVPYATAYERIGLPFPSGVVDTVGAHFLDRTSFLPPRSPGAASRPQAFIYSLKESEVSFVYPGLGQDTLRRAFVATVRRGFRNTEEQRLLRIAEETLPPEEAVLAIASAPYREALPKEKRLWWYGEFDGVRLPYAVTMDAVRYYLGVIQKMGQGDSTATKGIRMKRGEFSYHAGISTHQTYSRDGRVFKDVCVVEMKLRWSNYCGPLCACFFDLDRTVVLRRDGTVLCVFGDRKPMVTVS